MTSKRALQRHLRAASAYMQETLRLAEKARLDEEAEFEEWEEIKQIALDRIPPDQFPSKLRH